jgi:putative Holliday junction resolvase
MRKMGIDYGTKRVGVALTDEAGLMAFPHTVLKNDAALVATLAALIEEKGVSEVVVGHSLGRDGAPNPLHNAVEAFIGELTLAASVPAALEPEHYSTRAALRLQDRTDKIDAAAAALILNSYIERTRQV